MRAGKNSVPVRVLHSAVVAVEDAGVAPPRDFYDVVVLWALGGATPQFASFGNRSAAEKAHKVHAGDQESTNRAR
jgi:hypothetical protein